MSLAVCRPTKNFAAVLVIFPPNLGGQRILTIQYITSDAVPLWSQTFFKLPKELVKGPDCNRGKVEMLIRWGETGSISHSYKKDANTGFY